MIGWSRRRRRLIVAPLFVLIALLLLAAAAAPRAWAQQEEEDSSGSSSGSSSGIGEADVTSSGGVLEDGSKAWTWSDPGVDGVGGGGGGGGGEDFSGNKTGTLSHKRVPPEEGGSGVQFHEAWI